MVERGVASGGGGGWGGSTPTPRTHRTHPAHAKRAASAPATRTAAAHALSTRSVPSLPYARRRRALLRRRVAHRICARTRPLEQGRFTHTEAPLAPQREPRMYGSSVIFPPDRCDPPPTKRQRKTKDALVSVRTPPPPSRPASSKGFTQKQSTYRISAAPSGRGRCRRCRAVCLN